MRNSGPYAGATGVGEREGYNVTISVGIGPVVGSLGNGAANYKDR